MQVIKRRLVGKEGGERISELRTILDELPDYKSGPYADIRKWVNGQIEETRVRAKAVHRDSIAVRREGAAQIAFVGPPNAGKSSLLQALSSIQIKTGDYAFTTTRPVPALTRIRGVLVQLVEIPGLIEGATDDRGGGRALLGVLRGADAMVFCDAPRRPTSSRRCARSSRRRHRQPAILAATKRDEADGACSSACGRPGLDIVPVSVLDDASARRVPRRPLAADRPHPHLPAQARRGRGPRRSRSTAGDGRRRRPRRSTTSWRTLPRRHVWGPSAVRGQRVGREHELADDDIVEIVSAR